mgnify:FL=1
MDEIFTILVRMILITLTIFILLLLVDTVREVSDCFIGAILIILFGLFITFIVIVIYCVVTGG